MVDFGNPLQSNRSLLARDGELAIFDLTGSCDPTTGTRRAELDRAVAQELPVQGHGPRDRLARQVVLAPGTTRCGQADGAGEEQGERRPPLTTLHHQLHHFPHAIHAMEPRQRTTRPTRPAFAV